MTTFFTSVGIAAIAGVLIVAAVGLYYYFKLKRFLRNLARTGLGPDTIHLEPDQGAWEHAADLDAARAYFGSQGFEPVGAFVIPEMPGVRVAGFVTPGGGPVAVACEHPAAGFWADFVEKYRDDTSLTVTNAPRGHELDHRPGHDKLYLKGLDLAALHARFLAERRPAAPVVVPAGEFVAVFENAYADELAWRKGRGVTAAEVSRVAEEMRTDDDSRSTSAGA